MKKILIGKVYANWCGHCQSLKPEWLNMKKDLKSKMKKMGYLIEFVEIEEQERDKLKSFKTRFPNLQINGYPTIFKDGGSGKLEYYQGSRTSNEMGKWLIGNKGIHKYRRNQYVGGKNTKNKNSKNKKTKNNKTVKRCKTYKSHL